MITRKDLIRHGGLAAVASPFLRMLARPAWAAPGPTKRLVIFATSNGTVMEEFWPDPNLAFRKILQPLAPWKDKLVVMRGIDSKAALSPAPPDYKVVPRDHMPDLASALTGRQRYYGNGGKDQWINGISIDQHIANAIGSQTKAPSLYLGVGVPPDSNDSFVSRGVKGKVLAENSTTKVFDNIFSNFSPTPGTAPDPAFERLRSERKSVLDLLKGELSDLRCQLGAEERPKFDEHLGAVRTLENGLSPTDVGGKPTMSCVKPSAVSDTADYVKHGVQQMDLIAAALACDRTRVIVVMWGGGGSYVSHNWLGFSGSHHGISHNSEGVNAPDETRRQWLIQIETWQAQQYAGLLKRLNDIQDLGGGTLLDNSAVLWVHEQSNGYSHQRTDLPYVLAGSCAGYFKTGGRMIHFPKVAHNGLLISLANAMDVPTETFGDPQFSKGPLTELRV